MRRAGARWWRWRWPPWRIRTEPRSGQAVFLCYSHFEPDASYVRRLAAYLERQGVPAWFDHEPQVGLAAGDRFSWVLRERIDSCAAFVVVMSPNSAGSVWVGREIRRARRARRPFVPLVLAGEEFPSLSTVQAERVDGGVLPSARFVERLRAHVTRPAPPPGLRRTRLVGRGLPSDNPNFVGRETLLHRLELELDWGTGAVTLHALEGLGGVGKTQLAAEHAYRHVDDYDLIAWLDAERPELIVDQLATLAPELDLPGDPGDPAGTARAVLAALERTIGSWLLVFDNATAPHHLDQWRPRTGPGHVIITSRTTGWEALGAAIDVDVLTRAESIELLTGRAAGLDRRLADELAAWLGDLPLGLEQAGAFLKESGLAPDTYLRRLRERPAALLAEGRAHRHEHTIATLWELSAADLAAASPAAARLLTLCACLGPEPIPLDLFTAHPDLLPAPLAEVAGDGERFTATVEALTRRSLARRSPGVRDPGGTAGPDLTLHRLLATAVRADLSPARWAEAIATVRELLYQHLPPDVMNAPETWPVWAALLPHVLAATTHEAPGRDENDPADRADRTAWLLDGAGTYLQTHGRMDAARPLLERALAIDEAALGPEHPTVATRLSNLATLLGDLGDPAAARPLLERAIRIGEATLGPTDPLVAIRLSNLATLLLDLGDAAGARPLHERALAIDEAVLGPDHPDVAIRLNNLAMVLRDLGDPIGARPLAERALAITEAARGPTHPEVAIRLNNLAMVLRDLGDPAGALPLVERALAISEAVVGPTHPTVAIRLNNLAMTLLDLGDAEAARPLVERALAISEAVGPTHPSVAVALNNLGLVLRARGDAAGARPLLERAVAITETRFGPNHPSLASRLANLGRVLADLGDSTGARALLERALAIGETQLGPRHPTTRATAATLAELLS